MSIVIDLGERRWAEEPPGTDTIQRYERVAGAPKKRINAEKFASLWKLKGSK